MIQRSRLATAGALASALMLASGGAAAALDFKVGDTEVSFDGFVMAKFAYDLKDKFPHGAMHAVPGQVALDDDDYAEGHFDATAEQTRLGFSTRNGDLATRIEGDFFGGSFRIRHAYGTYKNFLVGQTWSNFGSFIATMPTIDFASLVGDQSFDRFTQVRYTLGNFAVALEDPDAAATFTPQFADGAEIRHGLPRLTARYEAHEGPLSWVVAAGLQSIDFDDGNDSDSAIGYGVMTSARYQFGPVTVRGGVRYGDGVNTMTVSLWGNPNGAYGDAYLKNGSVETIESVGGIASVGVKVGPGEMNVGYGRMKIDYPDSLPLADKTLENALVNYFWSPVENITLGLEYGWYAREQVNGDDGSADRITGSVMYSF